VKPTLDRKLYDDRNPMLPEPCPGHGGESTAGPNDVCLLCGRAVIPEVKEAYTPAQQVVLICIEAWAKEHGGAPTPADWPRCEDGHPGFNQVIRIFGCWAAAIEAAGFTPRRHRRRAAA
jgi:hypothetical protein